MESGGGLLRIRKARAGNLQELDLDLQQGAWTAVHGASGAGKSALLFGLLAPVSRRRFRLLDDPAALPGGGEAWLKPLADRVIVSPMEKETMKGGIIIPDTAKEKPQQGKIVAVGPGSVSDSGERVAPEVKKGDIVLYGKYAGTEVNVDGNDYLILRESDVLAILG